MSRNLYTFGVQQFWRIKCVARRVNPHEAVLDVLQVWSYEVSHRIVPPKPYEIQISCGVAYERNQRCADRVKFPSRRLQSG